MVFGGCAYICDKLFISYYYRMYTIITIFLPLRNDDDDDDDDDDDNE